MYIVSYRVFRHPLSTSNRLSNSINSVLETFISGTCVRLPNPISSTISFFP
ncbi:uncharacterized protein DS421_18g616110 [Arachis hypogaea]|nr:uncharacterized protein DS421_18g616110 [Arachis hypogaea]